MSTQIMGIINTTPDSFSGDGVMCMDTIIAQAREFINHGATILDIGGESTHPKSPMVDAETEIARVIPVITELSKSFPYVTLSVDTYKSTVAEQAMQAGATIINDVWGGLYDGGMYNVAMNYDVDICLMHNSSPWKFSHAPAVDNIYAPYDMGQGNYPTHAHGELTRLVDNAVSAGVKLEKIIADVGVGFGKEPIHSMALINHLNTVRPHNCRMLLGASRKGFIGHALSIDINNASDRDYGTAACVALGIANGADIVRVHNVNMMAQIVKMTDAVLGA